MSTLSFFVRVTLWAVAAIMFTRVVFMGGNRVEIVVLVVVLVAAFLHRWYDEKEFGALVREHAMRLPHIKKMIARPKGAYQIYCDTYYHRDTPEAVVHLLETLRRKDAHVQIHYGNVESGLEKRVVTGYIERSTGSPQILLLVQLGEPGVVAILDHHIVRLIDLDREGVCYQHPAYHQQPEEATTDPAPFTLDP